MTTADERHIAYVSLGANIEPEKNLAAAIKLLRERSNVLAVSAAYRTPPMGFVEQADFLNMAVKLTIHLSPEIFKAIVLNEIERQLGRVRDPLNKNAARTIDLDISLWDNCVLDYGAKPWHIPEPDILRFGHVAVPLAEIAPNYVHPETGESLAEIAARFDISGMRREAISFE